MIDQNLRAWAAKPGPAKVLAVARRRIERGGQLERGSLPAELSPEERKEVGAVVGVDWVASGRDVSVLTLRSALEARNTRLIDLLAATGPLRDRRAERAAARAEAAVEKAEALSIVEAAGINREAAAHVFVRRGVPKAGSGQLRSFAADVAKAWLALPGPGSDRRVALTVLAGDLFKDPHALDRSTALGRTIARLAVTDTEGDVTGSGDVGQADVWRAAWAAVGVDTDTVSSMVLVLNLALEGEAPAVRLTQAAGAEPVWLSLRSLDGDWRPLGAVTDAWVCENPTILEAAADHLGSDCPPLVCTFGRPSSAGIRLLRHLGQAGVRIHVRADDDPTGQSIVAQLLTDIPAARPWRYTPRPPADAAHNPRFEEQLVHDLLADLAAATARL